MTATLPADDEPILPFIVHNAFVHTGPWHYTGCVINRAALNPLTEEELLDWLNSHDKGRDR